MDLQISTVCCLCGDVGFSDHLFRCSICRRRFQHSYCSNYRGEQARRTDVCDWCLSEKITSSPSSSSAQANGEARSVAYTGGKKLIKQHNRTEGGTTAEKAAGKSPSPRPPARRYKLLKDVMF